jgi:thiol-disulfide isomerase/thioredoxin
MRLRASASLVLAAILGSFAAFLPALASPARAADYEVWEPPKVGDELPDYTLPDTSGKLVHLSDFRGKVILLSFWACYSDSCFTSVPSLEELARKFGPAGLVSPSVCFEVAPALAADGYAGLVKRCASGQVALIDEKKEYKLRMHVLHSPTAFLVGRDFRIREIVVNIHRLRDPQFAADIERIVAEQAPPAPAPAPAAPAASPATPAK